jgi:hypothetical protein
VAEDDDSSDDGWGTDFAVDQTDSSRISTSKPRPLAPLELNLQPMQTNIQNDPPRAGRVLFSTSFFSKDSEDADLTEPGGAVLPTREHVDLGTRI